MNDLNNRSDTLTQPDYRARVVDGRLGKLLKAFGAVEIVGPKWCGKTWTALSRSRSMDRLDDAATFAAAQTDPALVLMGNEPHLVDEWQDVPLSLIHISEPTRP